MRLQGEATGGKVGLYTREGAHTGDWRNRGCYMRGWRRSRRGVEGLENPMEFSTLEELGLRH